MTGDDFFHWRQFMKLSKVSAAKALGVGRNTILSYEKADKVPLHIELACAALACKVNNWKSVRSGGVIALRRSELERLSERFDDENSDAHEEWREHVRTVGMPAATPRRRFRATL